MARSKQQRRAAAAASKEGPKPGPAPEVRRLGRNDPCSCNSGKKYKNCCGRPDPLPPVYRPPRLREVLDRRYRFNNLMILAEPATSSLTAQRMLRASIDPSHVWAYMKTRMFVTEHNRTALGEAVSAWDAAVAEYATTTSEDREAMFGVDPQAAVEGSQKEQDATNE